MLYDSAAKTAATRIRFDLLGGISIITFRLAGAISGWLRSLVLMSAGGGRWRAMRWRQRFLGAEPRWPNDCLPVAHRKR